MANGNEYDAAKWALMPELAPSPANPEGSGGDCCAAPATAVPGVFEPVQKFDGGRVGWLFKRGPLGVGYYRDAPMEVSVPKKG